MDSKRVEPETINVWELMSGLDDTESSPKPKMLPAKLTPKHITVPATLAEHLSSDTFTLEPSNEASPSQRKPSLKANANHRRSPIYVLKDPVAHKSTSRESATNFDPIGTPSSNGSSLFGSVSGSNMYTVENLADNLQRSLSFKLVFNRENKGILGLEDTLFSSLEKGDFSDDMASNVAPHRRTSEGDSGTLSSSPFSASAKLMKWFKANKHALKLQNPIKGGSKASMPDGELKKPSPNSATPPLPPTAHSASIGPVSSFTPNRKGYESWLNRKASDCGSNGKASDDFSENGDMTLLCSSSMDEHKITGTPESGPGPFRRYRHSFSNANRSNRCTEEIKPASINRPSSWELEKVAVEPGDKAVLYSTNLRTDINAYEDSNAVRAILISLVGSSFNEKSVSQHPDYEQELKNVLNLPVVTVPTVWVRGKYVAGIDNIMQLFKKGLLGSLLLETLPHGLKPNGPCMCKGGKFLICPICKGKRKLTREGEEAVSCRHCIGTGLLKCPSCPKP